MPQFNDSDNHAQMAPEGDYVWTVVDCALGISAGGKTSGSTVYKLKLEITMPDGKPGPIVFENLIDHPSTAWKIDTFTKSGGVKLTKGQDFDFDANLARSRGALFVNPFGLRGWCRLSIEEYKEKKRNRVALFYTDKAKLAPDPALQAEGLGGPTEEDVPF